MDARRVMIVLVVLLLVATLAASLAPIQDRPRVAGQATTETSATTTTSSTTAATPGSLVEEEMVAGRKPAAITLDVGDELRLTVSADETDQVEIVGLGLIEDVDPDAPAFFDLVATEPGVYPIELVSAGDEIGRITVQGEVP